MALGIKKGGKNKNREIQKVIRGVNFRKNRRLRCFVLNFFI